MEEVEINNSFSYNFIYLHYMGAKVLFVHED